jgi:hypothetical protein
MREKSREAFLKRGGAKPGVRPESSELTIPNRDASERPEGGEIGSDPFPDRRVKRMRIAKVSRESPAITTAKPASPGGIRVRVVF